MSDLALDERPRRGAGVVTRSAGSVVVETRSGRIRLNETAFALWELCDGNTTVAEMIAAVCQLFEIDAERAARDVTEIITRMRDTALIA